MIGRTFGTIALAASALGAQAFLLPPNVDSVDGPNRMLDLAIDTTSRTIKLPCSDCAFPMKQEEQVEGTQEDDFVWIQGGANSIVLEFSVQNDDNSMSLNGRPIFPPQLASEKATVKQVASSASMPDIKMATAKTSTLQVSDDNLYIIEEQVGFTGDSIVRIIYRIMELEHQPVSVDDVDITMIKSSAGDLQILSVVPVTRPHVTIGSQPVTSPDAFGLGRIRPQDEDDRSCAMLPAALCRLKKTFGLKIEALKSGKFGGCHGKGGAKKLPGHIKPHIHWEGENGETGRKFPGHMKPHPKWEGKIPEGGKLPSHMRPHIHMDGLALEMAHGGPARPHHHHGHHGHRQHHGHFLHRLIKGFVMVLIPVMAGITMGMVVSLIGMLVGRLIAFMWIKFRRGGQRGYASVAHEEEVAEKGEIILDESTEPLPVYEEAPAYEETDSK